MKKRPPKSIASAALALAVCATPALLSGLTPAPAEAGVIFCERGPDVELFRIDGEAFYSVDTSFDGLLNANLFTQNTVFALLGSRRISLSSKEYSASVPDYNVFTNGELEGFEDYLDNFRGVRNPVALNAIKMDIILENAFLVAINRACLF
jgi:hypothetical protein